MIYKEITESAFLQAFDDMNRGDNYSYEGRQALYGYLSALSECVDIELDIIGICCDFDEWENLEEFQQAYGQEYETLEDIEERTQVIRIDDEAFITVVF